MPYTIDGGQVGEMEYEISTPPRQTSIFGTEYPSRYAKDKMINALIIGTS